jgi:mannose-6-phosphate isomerase
MERMSNPVRRYDWGSRTAIPELLGVEPDGEPQAELWLGAHESAPSSLAGGQRLDEAIAGDPGRLVGGDVRDRFGDRLPYLAKILAADAPLSLQVHPNAQQARAGFAAEEDAGVPRDARNRRYRDPYHKPELIIALTRFDALCGLRPIDETRELVHSFEVDDGAWHRLCAALEHDDEPAALSDIVGWLLGEDPRIPDLVELVGAQARVRRGDDAMAATIADLVDTYPRDPGVLVALLLHRVTLEPRESLYLPAGNIHAYLRGTGLEVMASSDNVLRAGLTSKHVDRDELLRIADWTPRSVPRVRPRPVRGGVGCAYRPGVEEFEVVLADLDGGMEWQPLLLQGPRIALALSGTIELRTRAAPHDLEQGQSAFVPADDGQLTVRGAGALVVVGVPAGT